MPSTIGTPALSTDIYPSWKILLGTGPATPDSLFWLTDADFYDLEIIDKIFQIPEARFTVCDMEPDDLEGENIRAYLDGKKKFSGKITTPTRAYRSNEVQVEAYGLAEYLHKQVIDTKTDYRNTLTSTIITENLMYSGWEYDIDTNVPDYLLNYRLESGNFLSHLNNLAIINYAEWLVDENDSTTGVPTRIFKITSRRGNLTPTAIFKLESNSYNGNITNDKTKVYNVIAVSGGSSQASNMDTTAAGFFDLGTDTTPMQMGNVIGNESYLAEPIAIGEDEAVLEDATGYPDAGTVQIDDEVFEYTSKTVNSLNLDTTATEDHDPDTPVLKTSLMRMYLPSSMPLTTGKVWVGNELISFTSHDYWGIHGLTRGSGSTPVYAHGDGTKVFSGDYSLSSPHANSSIALWTRSDKRVMAIGVSDRDGLDKYGTSLLLAVQEFVDYGSHFVTLDELQGIGVGDNFYLQEYQSDEKVLHRCTGIVYGMEEAEIIWGLNDEGILNQFDDITKIDDSTYAKQDLNDTQEIVAVSSNKKSVQVQMADGTYKWVAVK